MNPDGNNHFGYLSGKEDFIYYIKRESKGIYNLYKLVNAKGDYMGCFDDFESAQTHAEQLEANPKIIWKRTDISISAVCRQTDGINMNSAMLSRGGVCIAQPYRPYRKFQ